MPDGEAIEHRHGHALDRERAAQGRRRNFDMRKQLLEYDDVANDQRKVIYQQRNDILEEEDSHFRRSPRTCVADRHGRASSSMNFVPAGSLEEQWDTGLASSARCVEAFVKPEQLELPRQGPGARGKPSTMSSTRSSRRSSARRHGSSTTSWRSTATIRRALRARDRDAAKLHRHALARAPAALDYLRQGITCAATRRRIP